MDLEDKEIAWKINEDGIRILFGVGFVGEGFYKARYLKKYTTEYETWYAMIRRCYSLMHLERAPSYEGCKVDERWFNFQVFAQWYCEQKMYGQKGWELDKDIITKGNKIYSPETCCLLPKKINSMIAIDRVSNGRYPVGVSSSYANKNPFRVKAAGAYVGHYSNLEDAVRSYKTAKELSVKQAALQFKDDLDVRVFDALMLWAV